MNAVLQKPRAKSSAGGSSASDLRSAGSRYFALRTSLFDLRRRRCRNFALRTSPFDLPRSGDADAASDVENPYTFTARRLDVESGLMQYRNRHYDPALGRFVSRDPSGYTDGFGLFEYAGSRPVGATDASGLASSGLIPQARKYMVHVGNNVYISKARARDKEFLAKAKAAAKNLGKSVRITNSSGGGGQRVTEGFSGGGRRVSVPASAVAGTVTTAGGDSESKSTHSTNETAGTGGGHDGSGGGGNGGGGGCGTCGNGPEEENVLPRFPDISTNTGPLHLLLPFGIDLIGEIVFRDDGPRGPGLDSWPSVSNYEFFRFWRLTEFDGVCVEECMLTLAGPDSPTEVTVAALAICTAACTQVTYGVNFYDVRKKVVTMELSSARMPQGAGHAHAGWQDRYRTGLTDERFTCQATCLYYSQEAGAIVDGPMKPKWQNYPGGPWYNDCPKKWEALVSWPHPQAVGHMSVTLKEQWGDWGP